MLTKFRNLTEKTIFAEILNAVKRLNSELDEYNKKISILENNQKEPDLCLYERQHLGMLTDLLDLIGYYHTLYPQKRGREAAEALARDIKKDRYFSFSLTVERWEQIHRLLETYHEKYPHADVFNYNFHKRTNAINFLKALQKNIALDLQSKMQKKAILQPASESLKDHYLNEVNKELDKAAQPVLAASCTNKELENLKIEYQKNNVMVLTIRKYQAMREICSTLEPKNEEKHVGKQLEDFQTAYNKNIKTLKENRDKPFEYYMKLVAATLCYVSVVGIFYAPKIWETRAHQYEQDIKTAAPAPAP